ncbi:hypothetical protein CK556_02470 [Mesoplasma chauliocola]|uniref:Uncharacterized protein n=1 Tax=Mesoplasma chauliocola TaxID=216427 RepID=A0A249SNI0_9MOLU|nr:hypothetical protein [Mesoplasma chauliocola]ASZ09208.1 hypothetical protein CK556_02470 [Mesoplasma chauliocola]
MKKVWEKFKIEVFCWKTLLYVMYILFFIFSVTVKFLFAEFFYALFSANLALFFFINMIKSFKTVFSKGKIQINILDILMRGMWISLLIHELIQIIINDSINQFTALYWNNFIFTISFIMSICFFIIFLFNINISKLLKDYKFKSTFINFKTNVKEFIRYAILLFTKVILKAVHRIKTNIFKFQKMLYLYFNKLLTIINFKIGTPPKFNLLLI